MINYKYKLIRNKIPCNQFLIIVPDLNKKSVNLIKIRVLEVSTVVINQNKRKENKIKAVVSKLENISVEDLAKILIEARKTKLLEIQE